MPGRGIEDPGLWLDSSNSNDVRSRVDKYKLVNIAASSNTPSHLGKYLRAYAAR